MTQSGVSAFVRLARRFAMSAVLLFASAGALAAQTGKLEGKVRDQAGAPIQSAQVFIVGTAFSALTNAQGYYFINNIPAGTISVRGAFIGYKKTEIEGVKILAGQTITQDIQLEKATVVIDSLVVTTATNPLVPRDAVTTKQTADGEISQNLPVDRVGQILALQPGVVAENNGTQLSIRGGRTDEAAFYVDGVSTQPGNRGNGFVAAGPTASNAANDGGGLSSSGVAMGTNGFEEVSVTTGAAAAQYGNAQAGIVSITSRTGGNKFAGRLAVESDELFGSTIGMGYNRFEGNFSGPLILNGLTFAVNVAGEGNESVRSGKGRQDAPVFVDVGRRHHGATKPTAPAVDVNQYSIYRVTARRSRAAPTPPWPTTTAKLPRRAAAQRELLGGAAGRQHQLLLRQRLTVAPRRRRQPEPGEELHLLQHAEPGHERRTSRPASARRTRCTRSTGRRTWPSRLSGPSRST